MSEETISQSTESDGGVDGAVTTNTSLGWKTEIPESQRGHEAFAAYGTKSDFHKGHLTLWEQNKANVQKIADLEGKVSKSIIKPGDDATQEQIDAYNKSLRELDGVPSKPEDYSLSKPNDWPADIHYDASIEKAYRDEAFRLGIGKEKAESLFNWHNNLLKKAIEQLSETNKKASEDAISNLKSEWGADYEKNVSLCAKTAEVLKGKYKSEWLVAQDDPMIAYLLFELSSKYINDSGGRHDPAPPRPQDRAGISYPDMPKT